MPDTNPTTDDGNVQLTDTPSGQLYGRSELHTLATMRETMDCAPWNDPPEKLQRAYETCLAGGVRWDTQAEQWVVLSKSHEGVAYPITIEGQCSCPQAMKRYHGAPNSCSHAVAAAMQQRFDRELEQDWYTGHGKAPARRLQGVALPQRADEPEVLSDEEQGWYAAHAEAKVRAATLKAATDVATPSEEERPERRQAPTREQSPKMPEEAMISPNPSSLSAPLFPHRVGYRSLAAIVADLHTPLPEACIAHRNQNGEDIRYLHWYDTETVLDTYAPGWEGVIVSVQQYPGVGWDALLLDEQEQYFSAVERDKKDRNTGKVPLPARMIGKVVVRYRLTIPHAEGVTSREDIGWEDDNNYRFGDPFSNAKAMALCRAAGQFGLRSLYEDKGTEKTSTALREHLRTQTRGLWAKVRTLVETHGIERTAVQEWLLRTSGTTQREEVLVSALQQMGAWLSRGEPLDSPEAHEHLERGEG